MSRHFEVQFTSPQYSIAELTAFAVDHEARLTSNNPDGVFDDLVAATATTLDEIVGASGREKSARAVQKSRTAAKNHQRAIIQDTLSRQSGIIGGQFGKTSTVYLHFFPRGVTEFRRARDAEIPAILQSISDAATAHLPELVPVFQQLLDDWNAAAGDAATRRAVTGTSAQARSAAFDKLRRQLTKNHLIIASHYVGQPDMARVYFDNSLLFNRQQAGSAEPESEGDELPEPPVMV